MLQEILEFDEAQSPMDDLRARHLVWKEPVRQLLVDAAELTRAAQLEGPRL